ncbi:MAG: hypothetical protein L6R48_03060 [Planctomycetes bacterium]|nr:hypothetical protein [Planctomycetota bacterium]
MPWRLLLLLLSLSAGLHALEVREVRWGFDGAVVPGRFNPLAVLVANPRPFPFEGTVELSQGGGPARSGAPWVQPAYLAPGGSRWLQFAPWVAQGGRSWRLGWDGGSLELEDPREGPPGTVLLDDGHGALGAGSAAFPDELFPVTVALTDPLARLVVDHAPRWSPEQRQACAAWVRRGGELHLAQGPDGRAPRLAAELAELAARPGAGRVVQHQGPAGKVRAVLLGEREAAKEDQRHSTDPVELIQRALGGVVQARPAWGWIFLVLAGFLLLAGPGTWWLGKRRPWWLVQGALLALVALTTVAIGWIGRRGFGESEITRLAVAAVDLGDGSWDATWFGSTFVTGTRTLHLRPPVDGRALLACPGWESVEGAVLDAEGGRLDTAVPLFSVRHWCARGRTAAALPAPVVATEGLNAGLLGARITLPSPWPAATAVQVVHGGRVFACTQAPEGGWRLEPGGGTALEEFAQRNRHDSFTPEPEHAERALAAAAEALATQLVPPALAPRPGRLAVLVTIDLPTALHLAAGVPGRQEGRLVLRHDLPLESP